MESHFVKPLNEGDEFWIEDIPNQTDQKYRIIKIECQGDPKNPLYAKITLRREP